MQVILTQGRLNLSMDTFHGLSHQILFVMRVFYFAAAAVAALFSITATNAQDKTEKLDSVVVSTSRAGKSTPVTYTMVGSDVLRKSNPSYSLPMALSLQPSVVVTNEGGTGLGYSKMTVRGSKGSQINVTLNGITLNDAESQEVFWVNIPALTNIVSSVQVQRGLGTSANGSGAFGASINMSTASVGQDPTLYFEFSRGSFNTSMTTVSAGTGLLPGGLYFSGAYSIGRTDGYIRNAFAKVQSAFAVAGWLKGNNSLRFTWLMGDQHTGITWNGISLDKLSSDRKYNSAGEWYDTYGNVHYYDNDSDNYTQHHLQLNYTRMLSEPLTWSTTVNFTKGDGYYEELKAGKKYSAYGMDKMMELIAPESFSTGNFIIHKSMDNGLWVVNSDLRYRTEKLNLTGGINLSRHDGDHFGEVLWDNHLWTPLNYDEIEWYRNNGLKKEMSVFARAEYLFFGKLSAYSDLQYRGIALDMTGPDDNFVPLDYSVKWNFFNPRAGITWTISPSSKAYVSVALGHREPGRSDLKENIESFHQENKGLSPEEVAKKISLKPERMVDTEIGYEYSGKSFSASVNLYSMEYRNMLLETGKLSAVGYALKENVPESYRRGVEIAAAWKPSSVIAVSANLTLSRNKIKDYTGYYENYDNSENWNLIGEYAVNYGKTTMLMSPSVIGMAKVTISPFSTVSRGSLKTTALSIDCKYVGSQYWDNTECEDRKVPAYFVSALSLTHEFRLGGGCLGLGAYVNNLFNNHYYSDAWVYRAHFEEDSSWSQSEGVFPQATINGMFKIYYRF